jgi:hypothetical protein
MTMGPSTAARRRIAAVVAAGLAIAGGWFGLSRRHTLTPASPPHRQAPSDSTAHPASRGARLAALEYSLRAIDDGDRGAPRDRWDPGYVVESVGRDPAELFAWVRDSTSWIPYRGELRGPVGVLMDRQGNSLDRSLLLATLLEAAGHSVRLAHGGLSRDQARDLLPGLIMGAPADAASESPRPSAPAVQSVAAKYRLDATAVARALEKQEAAASGFYLELDTRTSEQSERLLKHVGSPDPRPDWIARFDRAVGALRDHWWVQHRDGDAWIDLDLLGPAVDSLDGPLVPAAETMAPGDIPDTLRHELDVRVLTEQWTNGALSEQRVLQHLLRPVDIYGQPIVLSIWPGNWPAQVHSDPESKYGLRGTALDQHRWGVALLVGKDAAAQALIRDDAGPEAPGGGGGFGGLGAAIARAVPPTGKNAEGASRSGELTAVWIEYEFRTPGEGPRVVRRAVFDLIGPAARSAGKPVRLVMDDARRLMRSLALMIRTELLPLSARIPVEYVTHLTARSVVANGPLLRLIAQADGAHVPEPDSLLARVQSPLTILYSLAAARLAWSPVSDRVYVDRLGLLTHHRHPAASAEGFGVRGAVDVVAGEVGVTLAEPDAFEVRLRQGVFDTNAEALWWAGASVLNTGEAYRAAKDWVTVTPSHREALEQLQLPPDARVRIAQDLDAGLVVIAPRAPVSNGMERFTGWWRIDPVTGLARGAAGSGWGQCQAEYANLVGMAILRGAGGFAFEYALCQGIAQAINEIRRKAADLQARGVWFSWTGSVQAMDANQVFKESHEGCMISAMMSGVLATLPIILKIRQLYKLRAARATPFRPPLPYIPPPPRGKAPRFVREAKEAFVDADRRMHQASELWSKYAKQPNPNRGVLKELEDAYRARQREAVEAFESLQDARREAGRMPPTPQIPSGPRGPKPISEYNREYASELLELGFGGLLRGK